MQAKDVPPLELFYTTERMGDGRNNMEVREVFYVRDHNAPCRYPHNVRIGRIGIIQGDPESADPPRYRRIGKEPCRDPGEMDGRTVVHLLSKRTAVWEQSISERTR